MERLTFHTYRALRKCGQCALVGPAGSGRFIEPDTPIAECKLKPLPRFLAQAWIKGQKMARALRPRVVIAASGLTAPAAIHAAQRSKGKAITVVHGLDLVTPQPFYQRFFIPAIRRSDIVIANSANTAKLAREAGVPAEKIKILHPGVTLPNNADSTSKIDQRTIPDELKNRKVLLSVGRLVPRKGLAEFVARAMPELVKRDPEIMLTIAGGEATDALKRGDGVLARIKASIQRHNLENHVQILGSITDDADLAAIYRQSHVFIMPLVAQDNDVEGFGMVAIEAAANGCRLPASASAGYRTRLQTASPDYWFRRRTMPRWSAP